LRSVSALYSAISDALPSGALELRVRRGLKGRTVSIPFGPTDAGTAADGPASRVGEHRV
jgi:hypothetical protein